MYFSKNLDHFLVKNYGNVHLKVRLTGWTITAIQVNSDKRAELTNGLSTFKLACTN